MKLTLSYPNPWSMHGKNGPEIFELAPIFKCRFCGRKIYTNHFRHYHVDGCNEEFEESRPEIVRYEKSKCTSSQLKTT